MEDYLDLSGELLDSHGAIAVNVLSRKESKTSVASEKLDLAVYLVRHAVYAHAEFSVSKNPPMLYYSTIYSRPNHSYAVPRGIISCNIEPFNALLRHSSFRDSNLVCEHDNPLLLWWFI